MVSGGRGRSGRRGRSLVGRSVVVVQWSWLYHNLGTHAGIVFIDVRLFNLCLKQPDNIRECFLLPSFPAQEAMTDTSPDQSIVQAWECSL